MNTAIVWRNLDCHRFHIESEVDFNIVQGVLQQTVLFIRSGMQRG